MLAMLHRRHCAKPPSRTFPVKILAQQPPATMKRRTATTSPPTARPAQTIRNETETPIPSVLVPRSIDLAFPPPFHSLGFCLLPNSVRGPTNRFFWRTRAYLPLSLASARPIRRACCSIADQIPSGGASVNCRLGRRRWR